MTIIEIKPEYVFGTVQMLTTGQVLQVADFEKGEMRDATGLNVGYLQRLISSENVKFFLTKEA